MSKTTDQIPGHVKELRAYFNTHATKPYSWRKTQLEALHRLLTEHEDDIQNAVKKDLNKPGFEGRFSEAWIVATEIGAALDALPKWMAKEHVSTPLSLLPASSYIVNEPLGVVLIIAPFNYPVQLALNPLAVALAAGNVAVLKPSELTPASSALMAKLIPQYFAPNVVRVVEGEKAETTALLEQKWDLIFFTGSEMVGKVVQQAAAKTLTPTILELGGKSPSIIDKNTDLDLAVRRTIWGKLLNAGQTCIAPDYVYIHNSVRAKFFELAAKQIDKFYGKDIKGSDHYARIVAERHVDRLAKLIDAHRKDIKYGGDVDKASKYVSPTILDVTKDGKAMEEEIFGPVLPVIGYDNLDEVLDYVNSKPKPLALYVFSNSRATIDRVLNETSSGGVVVNDTVMHFTNPELPFGGVGSSGMGAYHGRWGFDAFSHRKPVLEKATWGDAPQRYPPYSEANMKIFKFIASIHRVDSSTFSNAFKFIGLPVGVAALAYYFGVRVHISLVQ